MRPSRFHVALAVATAVHGGVWLARAAVHEAPPAPVRAMVYEEASIDIDVSQVATSTGNPGSVGTVLSRHGSATAARSSHGAAAPVDAPGEIVATTPERSSGVISVWNTDALAQRELGVGETRSFAGPPPPVSEHDVVRDRVQRSITDGLRDREVAAGADPMSGPIVHALEDATTRGLTPVNGKATFDAVISAAGIVVSVGTVDASSDRAAWDDVAKASAASLAGRQLRTSKKGVVVRIEISSREQLPSGADPGVGVDILGAPVKQGQGPRSTGVHILPMLPMGGRATEFTILSVNGDPVDIGATARRVIGAHVTAVRDL